MKLIVRLAVALLLASPAASWADPLSNRGLDDTTSKGPQLTDGLIDERKKALDRVLSKRNEEAAKEASEAVALEGKLKQERLDFEKKQIADRRALLDAAKSEPDVKKRASLYGRFNGEQKNARRKFFNEQQNRRDELSYNARKSRMLPHDDVVLPAAKPTVKTTKK